MRPRPVIEALEKKHGRSFAELCEEAAAQKMSRREAADHLGVQTQTFRDAARAICPHVVWPGRNQSRLHKRCYQRNKNRFREWMIRTGRCVLLEHEGEEVTLSALARRIGISTSQMWNRYHVRGLRGAELLTPPHPTKGRAPEVYSLGYSMDEWQVILDYAEAHGTNAAAKKFDIPLGAITAVQGDQWEKVA